ncbi:MAG: formate dehydrogenase subunit alpha [Dehalococcoidales bacterium]|nr:formate dehydrogenase subunit alpha [Dehalococcoidales bacterium]
MKEITLTINGKQVKGWEGDNVLEICQKNDIYVPTLCHHEGLTNAGSCRMCVVEIENERRPVPSCMYPARDGLVVQTDTEKIKKYRKVILELLIAEHDHDCSQCENNGRCELQELLELYEVENTPFPITRTPALIDDSSPVILRDNNKCILCGRCIRACEETSRHRILSFADRGYRTFVAADLNEMLGDCNCLHCGACVQACPTGALRPISARGQGVEKEFTRIQTTCSSCGNGCQLEMSVKDGKIVEVYGVDDGPENKGHLCIKGRFGWDYVQHPDRLTTPLIKRDGKFEKTSWDEALDLVAAKFKEIKEKHGSKAIGGIASAKCSNEDNFVFQKFMRACLGSNNVDFCTRWCHTPSAVALSRAFGSGAMTNSIRDCDQSDVVLIAGFNPTETSPVLADFIKTQVLHNGLKLIVVDPREIEIADYAEIVIRPKIGTDAAWINGMMNVIMAEDLWDHEFVENRTENFEEFSKLIPEYTPEKVESITDVPKEQIIAAARLYGNAKAASIMFSMGITQHIRGTDNVGALCNLAMLTGNIGRAGTGVNTISKQNNGQGAGDMGCLPNVFPGSQQVANPDLRAKFEKAWNTTDLNPEPGITEAAMVCQKGTVQGLYVLGGNPMGSGPNLANIKEVIEGMEFVVVQDIFMTETAELADVVLPGMSFAEKDGTFTNVGRRVQRIRKAIAPVGESRSEWEVLCDLSTRLGYPMSYNSPADVMDEIASLVTQYTGIHYSRLDGQGIQWPCPNDEHPGNPFLHKDKFSRGLGFFAPVEYLPPAEEPDDVYPLVLTTGKNLHHMHTGAVTRRSLPLNDLACEDCLEMNPLDAEKQGVKGSKWVKVTSRRGQMELKLRITDRVPEGVVFTTFYSQGPSINILTNDELDPQGKTPELKLSAVKIEAV